MSDTQLTPRQTELEKARIRRLPAYMRTQPTYPEEFFDPSVMYLDSPGEFTIYPVYVVPVTKGHSPKNTKLKYQYLVAMALELDVDPKDSRMFPISIMRDDTKTVWFVAKKGRSERTNSILSKAKAKLAQQLADDTANRIWPP